MMDFGANEVVVSEGHVATVARSWQVASKEPFVFPNAPSNFPRCATTTWMGLTLGPPTRVPQLGPWK